MRNLPAQIRKQCHTLKLLKRIHFLSRHTKIVHRNLTIGLLIRMNEHIFMTPETCMFKLKMNNSLYMRGLLHCLVVSFQGRTEQKLTKIAKRVRIQRNISYSSELEDLK